MKLLKVLVFLLSLTLLFLTCGCEEDSSTRATSPQVLVTETPTPTPEPEPTPPSKYPEGTTVIAAVGDSLTYGSCSHSGGYPAFLQSKLLAAGYTNVIVLNAGIPGEQSHSTYYRFEELLTHEEVDIVLLMIGTNDIIDPEHCPIPGNCNTLLYLEGMLDTANSSHCRSLVSTIPLIQEDTPYDWANPKIRSLNAAIRNVAAQRAVTLVDNCAAITSDSLYVDGVHFTEAGYGLIADQWYQALLNSHAL